MPITCYRGDKMPEFGTWSATERLASLKRLNELLAGLVKAAGDSQGQPATKEAGKEKE